MFFFVSLLFEVLIKLSCFVDSIKLPGEWAALDDFQCTLVLKALRPDKVTNAMQNLVAQVLGQKFIEPQTTDLSDVFKESSTTTPLVFVLSTGTDPAGSLYSFAETLKFSKKLSAISLGQGQVIVVLSRST